MFMFIYRKSNDQSNNRSNKSNNQIHIIMFMYRQSNTVGNFLLSIGAPLYVPIYRLYILWSSMDNRKLPFVNSVMFVSKICSCAQHPGVWCPPITTYPLWSLCPLCSFTNLGGEQRRNQEFRFRFRQCRYRNFWQEKAREFVIL